MIAGYDSVPRLIIIFDHRDHIRLQIIRKNTPLVVDQHSHISGGKDRKESAMLHQPPVSLKNVIFQNDLQHILQKINLYRIILLLHIYYLIV